MRVIKPSEFTNVFKPLLHDTREDVFRLRDITRNETKGYDYFIKNNIINN